ncbi:hypothetical protein OHA70_31990 [Kribbella sp. NBC_00382]|uniref:hypothetical protein n=1 Tax=Kribbella sp. NBC_00382 TaxID=2975967 RepID=UPI002E1E7A0B
MSGILRLANEFIERMMNPAYGQVINDEYSMMLGDLLADGEDVERLLSEAHRLSRVDELSAYTWTWLLTLPGTENQLSKELLLELGQQFQAPAFRVAVIDCALRGSYRLAEGEGPHFDRVPTLDEIENPWLARLVLSTLPSVPDEAPDAGAGTVDSSAYQDAENLLVALLTVDWQDCRLAAVALLNHEWAGRRELLSFFRSRTTAMDEESRARWLRLSPPE